MVVAIVLEHRFIVYLAGMYGLESGYAMLLPYLPWGFHFVGVVFFVLAALRPWLLQRRRFLLLYAYFLADWAACGLGVDVFSEVYPPGEVPRLLGLLYILFLYPVFYLVYAALAVKAWEPLLGRVKLRSVDPLLYWILLIVYAAAGIPMLAAGLIVYVVAVGGGEVPAPLVPVFYIGAGLSSVVVLKRLRGSPARFLVAAPIIGHHGLLRILAEHLALGPFAFPGLDALQAYAALATWAMFPVPGFGGLHAEYTALVYLKYRAHGALGADAFYPPPATSLIILAEFILFYCTVYMVAYTAKPGATQSP
ncbi:hypothetical protein PABY_13600 [Pyrodictium abyssi]|uniref:Uncharacterized protein n=2 Tax=Pyrodictium abyssi TaxID=54256 RepID=A0ABN6ZV20_9CREN|nr:hypothetical protein PABY_13600 [Pyrodictium abyssi]